ncbi:MAG: hypothetical protein U0934_17745 [Pseudotabrizicola sp.]|uniref:hypothetical protein n=1 Tax=Pseudotabrizicola sp. TaxID=2939647 RepID=UPI002731DAD6|nr:hypothetical protein [Pseudotabrizicola sp.]MDP2081566.1 hypothetical protein [Pseudotabrizicola sp.]MDZ7575769.1 hypothetical protein [Pseudotabrizicola sp.]
MKELILHVGRSKCASSTIQKFLSNNPIIKQKGFELSYYCIARDGGILSGDAIRSSAIKSAHGYAVSSINFTDPADFFQGIKSIQLQSGPNESVVISNEGLGDAWVYEDWAARLDDLGIPIRVFMLTRPPVDWINASWWQWGCWETNDVKDWFNRVRKTMNFNTGYEQWAKVNNLSDLFVADISQGPLSLFLKFAKIEGFDFDPNDSTNIGSSADLLRFLLLNREIFGRTTHDATVEFALNSKLKFRGRKAPFVLSEAMVEEAIELSRADHLLLLDRMHWSDKTSRDNIVNKYTCSSSYEAIAQNFSLSEFLMESFDPDFSREIKEVLCFRT